MGEKVLLNLFSCFRKMKFEGVGLLLGGRLSRRAGLFLLPPGIKSGHIPHLSLAPSCGVCMASGCRRARGETYHPYGQLRTPPVHVQERKSWRMQPTEPDTTRSWVSPRKATGVSLISCWNSCGFRDGPLQSYPSPALGPLQDSQHQTEWFQNLDKRAIIIDKKSRLIKI